MNFKMAFPPINKMDCIHSRNFLFLPVLVVVFGCALLLAMPGGGIINPATVCADNGDDKGHSADEDAWEDNRDTNAYYQDMKQLDDERDRELAALEEEYNRELDEIEKEFQRDITEESDPAAAGEKYREKRDDLESKFDEKRRQLAEWYEEKASEIEGR